jgi:hypothetical protein
VQHYLNQDIDHWLSKQTLKEIQRQQAEEEQKTE